MSSVAKKEPAPQAGQDPVVAFVWRDIEARSDMGQEKHGTLLRTFNGRDALMDAYQEAIDCVLYLKQALMERDGA